MIAAIIIISLAFAYLLYETDFMRIRLESTEYQRLNLAKSSSDRTTDFESVNVGLNPTLATNTPTPMFLITQYCERTRLQREWRELGGKRYGRSDSWVYGTGYNTRRPESYQTMTIGKQAITLNATAGNLYEVIAEVVKVQTEKPRKASVTAKAFQPNLIEQVRVGSHHEYIRWNHETNESETSSKPKRGYSHRVENDYTTVYHDCLPGVEWLKAHEHDEYPEPTIEITVNGKALSVNGNYKQGVINNFMSQYTERVRAGKKTMTISKGDAVVNCGGGVYVVTDKAE